MHRGAPAERRARCASWWCGSPAKLSAVRCGEATKTADPALEGELSQTRSGCLSGSVQALYVLWDLRAGRWVADNFE